MPPRSTSRSFTTPAAWTEWYRLCAADRCALIHREQLAIFTLARLRSYLINPRKARFRPGDMAAQLFSGPPERHPQLALAYLEQYLWQKNPVGGPPASPRKNKLGELANRASNWEAGASKIIREAARSILTEERLARADPTVSIDAPLQEHESASTLDLSDHGESASHARAAAEISRTEIKTSAENFFSLLARREKLTLVAWTRRLPMSNPELCKLCGVAKSAASEIFNRVISKLAQFLDADRSTAGHARAQNASDKLFTAALAEIAELWGKTEIPGQLASQEPISS